MSKRSNKSRKKSVPDNAILIDRKAFLSVIGLTSQILDTLSEEVEMYRTSKSIPPEVKEALERVTTAHLANSQMLSFAIQNCVMDPLDPEGMRPVELQ